MTPRKLLLLAVALPLLASCTTNPGWMQPAPHAHNKYLVPVPDYRSTIVVSAPPGWHLDPEGRPIMLGSFVHRAHLQSPLVISTIGDRELTPHSAQATVYAHYLQDKRRTEAKRLAHYRQTLAGISPEVRPPPVTHDRVTWQQLSTLNLPDGRPVWISRFHSPISGYFLHALIPENGFRTEVIMPVDGAVVPNDLLDGITAMVKSYRCERH